MDKEKKFIDKRIREAEEVEVSKLKEVEMQEFVNSFSSKKGLEKGKELTKWITTGVFMGSSDAIPGYSGGTTLALIGFFKKLIILSRCVFIPKYGITRMRALLFLLPFAIGWITGVFGIAKITEMMATNGMGLELMFFFSAFVIAAIPIYLRTIKRDKKIMHRDIKPIYKTILAFIGFGIVIFAALYVLLVNDGAPFHGVDEKTGEHKFNMNLWWKLALVAYGAGMVTLIPGGSGAIVQLISGMYDKIHWTIMSNFGENILPLFIFALFTFLGMVTLVFIMSWFLVKKERQLEFFSLGMLLASPAAILIVPETSVWSCLKETMHIIGVVSAGVLGLTFGSTINWYTKKKGAH